jgi:hypothetical protein
MRLIGAQVFRKCVGYNRTRRFITVRSVIIWDITQRKLVIPYRRFGTTYRFHLPRVKNLLLKMEPIGCPETSAQDYNCTLRDIPENPKSHLRRCGSLKSLIHYRLRHSPLRFRNKTSPQLYVVGSTP